MLDQAANAWNGISPNIRVYGPGHTVPAGVTAFQVTVKGELNPVAQWGHMFDPLLTNRAYRIGGAMQGYNRNNRAAANSYWTHAEIRINVVSYAILLSIRDEAIRNEMLLTVLVHEIGHVLSLGHPEDVTGLTTSALSNLNAFAIRTFTWGNGQTQYENRMISIMPSALDRMKLRNRWG